MPIDFIKDEQQIDFRPDSLSPDPYNSLDAVTAGNKSDKIYDTAISFGRPITDIENTSRDIDDINVHEMLRKPAPDIEGVDTFWSRVGAIPTGTRKRTEEETLQYNFATIPENTREKMMAMRYIQQSQDKQKARDAKRAEEGDLLDINTYLAYFAGGMDSATAVAKANLFRNKPDLVDETDDTIQVLIDNPSASFVPSIFDVQLDQYRSAEIDMLSGMTREEREAHFKAKGIIGTSEFHERKDNREYMVWSDALKAMKNNEIRTAIDNLQDPANAYAKSKHTSHGLSPNYDRDLLLIRNHYFNLEETAARGTTGVAKLSDIGLDMVKYMGEIALLTGIVGGATKTKTAAGLTKLGLPTVIANNTAKLSSAAAMALTNPAMVTNLTIGRMTDKGYVGDIGEFVKTEEGQSLAKALPKSLAEGTATYYIEQLGDDLVKGVFSVGSKGLNKLPRSLVSKFDDVADYMKQTGIRSIDKLPKGMKDNLIAIKNYADKLLKAGKFDGIFAENIEEYVDKIAKPILLLDDQYRNGDEAYRERVLKSFIPDPEEIMYQSILFTLMPFAAGAIGSVPVGVNWASQKASELVEGAPTLPEVKSRIDLENSISREYNLDRKQSFEVADMLDRGINVDKIQEHIQSYGGDLANFRFDDHNNTKALVAMLEDRNVLSPEARRLAEITVQTAGEQNATVPEIVNTNEFKHDVDKAEKEVEEKKEEEVKEVVQEDAGEKEPATEKVVTEAIEETTDVNTEQEGTDEAVIDSQVTPEQMEGEQVKEPFIATDVTKPRGVSKSVEEEAIKKDLVESFQDVPDYQVVSMDQQGELAGKIITDNPAQAKRIAMGEEAAPLGVIPEMVYVAVANKATREGDAQTLEDLALRSKLNEQATEFGQRISAYGQLGDYSPVKAMQSIRRVRAEAMSSNEKANKKKLQKELAKARKDLAAAEKKLGEKEIDLLIKGEPVSQEATVDIKSKKYGSKNKIVSKDRKDEALKRLGDTSRLFAGIDPKQIADVIEVSVYHVEATGRNLTAWTEAMVKQFGDKVKPHLKRLWKDANKKLAQLNGDAALEKIAAGAEEGKDVTEFAFHIRALAKALILQGANTRVKLVDQVHAKLAEIFPGITKRETSDAISGYGQFRKLSTEEVDETLRDIKGQLQQLSKLEDMAAGIAPAKTGVERKVPSAEERALTKQVEEAKRKGGFNVTDPVKQLKTALEARKTRLKNQIEDLAKQIKEKKKTVKTKTATPTDVEVEALIVKRDSLKEEFDELFGKSKRSMSQRLAAAKARVKANIDDLTKRIESGNFSDKVKSDIAVDKELTSLRHKQAQASRVVDSAKEVIEHEGGISRDEVNNIMELSRRIEASRIAMEEGERRSANGKATDSEMAYGMSVVAYEKYVEAIQHKAAKKAIPQRLKQWADLRNMSLLSDIAGTAKSIRASMDNSFIGRQGIKLFYLGIAGDIKSGKIWMDTFARSIKTIMGSLAGKPVMDVLRAEILSDPQYKLMRRAKVATAVQEEEFPIHWPSKIPAIGRLFKASEEAFTASAYYMRYRAARMYFDIAAKTGVNLNDKIELQSIGKLVNSLTARGGSNANGGQNGLVNNVIWSPKMIKSNFDVYLAHQFDRSMSSFAHRQALKNLLRIVLGQAAALVLANAILPGSVSDDPTSSDFGKIKVGNTRFDISGGSLSMIVLAWRFISGKVTYSSGRQAELDSGEFGGMDTMDLVWNFLENKMSPAATEAAKIPKLIHGKTDWRTGEKVTLATVAEGLFVPLPFDNLMELMEDPDSADILLTMMLESFGVSSITYKTRKNTRR